MYVYMRLRPSACVTSKANTLCTNTEDTLENTLENTFYMQHTCVTSKANTLCILENTFYML